SCTGKTSLAERLGARYGCNLFHADDFFPRPEQRSPQRLAAPGGNMDRERLESEVLAPLRQGAPVSYRRFSCKTMTLSQPISPGPSRLNIVEGAYCLHPDLLAYYDLRVFLTLPWETRLRRLRERPGIRVRDYLERYIPMENMYFSALGIQSLADLVLEI
ncbi:MAG TPA: phosphoribulokinase, partial [Clostridia bacterium]|nr:phosphoribulokinase [Clostridia bacterium]